MDGRERIKRALAHEVADHVAITDTCWRSTIARWRREGLPPDVAPEDYFGYDMAKVGFDQSPRFPVKILDDDGVHVIQTTPYGRVVRNVRDFSSVPETLDFPFKKREDWEKKVKPRLVADPDRIDWDREPPGGSLGDRRERDAVSDVARRGFGSAAYRKAREKGNAVAFFAAIGNGHIHQTYLDVETLLMAVAMDPEWLIDMYETVADLVVSMYDIMVDHGFEFDAAFLSCDLGFNYGTFFSPRHFEQQLHPVFSRVFSFFHDRGIPVILHSDGRIASLIPYFIEEGVDCLNPLEAKAGMDLVELKKQYGDKLSFMGGIDVRAMADPDPAVIEQEIRTKVPVAMEGGGFIYHSDHSVPDSVSFDQYRRVIDLVLEYGTY